MSSWQQRFAEHMDVLCSQSSVWFDHFAQNVLDPAFESLSCFLERWHFEITQPTSDNQRRVFRFALTENGYLLIWFKAEGFDSLECEYEYFLPGIGRVSGTRTVGSLREVDPAWVENCFQVALDSFVCKFVDLGRRNPSLAPALV